MLKRFFSAVVLIVLCSGGIAAAQPMTSAAPPAPPPPGAARVWFLWTSDSMVGGDTGATPYIYVNGTPIATISGGTAFYRDFPPGTYGFKVQDYGLPNNAATTLQLAPGSQTYLVVSWESTWEENVIPGRGPISHAFFIHPIPPQVATAYIATMVNVGPR